LIVLGLNAFHGDSAAALLIDGKLVAAVEEERFLRIKHWAGLPVESVRYCLREAGIGLSQVDHVALSFNPKKNLVHKLMFALAHPAALRRIGERMRRRRQGMNIRQLLTQGLGESAAAGNFELHMVDHHLAHAASTYFASGWDEAAILTVDGMGDFSSTTFGYGHGSQIKSTSEVHFPHSLGFLYTAVTMYLGFPKYGDEYKVMGLAPYGRPRFVDEFRRIIRPTTKGFTLDLSYFTHVQKGIKMQWENGDPQIEAYFSPKLTEVFGPAVRSREALSPHHEDIAASLQAVTEEIIFHLATLAHQRAPSPRLCFAGGCAMNSVANGKLRSNTPFQQVYIPPGAADNGTSFGAAMAVHARLRPTRARTPLRSALLGPAVDSAECERVITAHADRVRATQLSDEALRAEVVRRIMDGLVIGWFRGRMEFGARALGARSLLADPRRTDIRDIINLKIKMREKFRPFAPSILAEHVADWFENPCDVPFMEQVLPFRPEKRQLVPAVCHVDGTGRLQSVHRETNPDYWQLIQAFYEKTGVPMLLNTSLNENEPIVCTPAQALDCFLRTKMDAIVLGHWLVERR
jgi:carbamoyltransferase